MIMKQMNIFISTCINKTPHKANLIALCAQEAVLYMYFPLDLTHKLLFTLNCFQLSWEITSSLNKFPWKTDCITWF